MYNQPLRSTFTPSLGVSHLLWQGAVTPGGLSARGVCAHTCGCVVVVRKFLHALNVEQRSALHRLINNTIKPSKKKGKVRSGWTGNVRAALAHMWSKA